MYKQITYKKIGTMPFVYDMFCANRLLLLVFEKVFCVLYSPSNLTRCSPRSKFDLKFMKKCLAKRLGEDISELLRGRNKSCDKGAKSNFLMYEVIINGNVFC